MGIFITKSDTDYNLAAGHSEGMLSHPELMRLFREFFMKRLVRHCTLADQETCDFLAGLIGMAEKI